MRDRALETLLNKDVMEGIDQLDHDNKEQVLGVLGKQMALNQLKSCVLDVKGDSTFSMSALSYLVLIESAGFKKILEIAFRSRGHNNTEEKFYIHWNDGMLLVWDTFWGDRNSANLYCEVELKETPSIEVIEKMYAEVRALPLSGLCFSRDNQRHPTDVYYQRKDIRKDSITNEERVIEWDGWRKTRSDIFFDGREALLYTCQRIREVFNVVTDQWREKHFLWLLHHDDTYSECNRDKNYDPKKITAERLAMLPIEVQRVLNQS